ncbi:ArsR/SmtB family transcription factor [Sphingopyxis panaciterrae]
MTSNAKIAEIAAQVGHPARTAMLVALMDGRALAAGELAAVAGVTPATASGHLAQLTGAGLLTLESQGRHRYHRLASPAIAAMIEGIMTVASDPARRAAAIVRTGPRDPAMRLARTCYDHLAGQLAVAVADHMAAAGHLEMTGDGGMLTDSGSAFLQAIGIALPDPAPRRPFCRPCLDWSERRPHLGGWLGAALLTCLRDRQWVRAQQGSRTLLITPPGARELHRLFAIDIDSLGPDDAPR